MTSQPLYVVITQPGWVNLIPRTSLSRITWEQTAISELPQWLRYNCTNQTVQFGLCAAWSPCMNWAEHGSFKTVVLGEKRAKLTNKRCWLLVKLEGTNTLIWLRSLKKKCLFTTAVYSTQALWEQKISSTQLTRKSRNDSASYALQSLWNAPYSEACNSTKQCWVLSDQQADFIQFFVASTQGITANECCDEAELETCIGDVGVTSFNSCPNPWLETASPLYWCWIRLDLTRSHSQPSARPVFPMLRSNYQFYMAPQFIPYRCQSIHPPPHCNKPILHEERDKKKSLPHHQLQENIFVLAVKCYFRYPCWNPPTS